MVPTNLNIPVINVARIGNGAGRAHLGAGKPLPATPDHRGCKAAVAEGRADEVMPRWSEIEAMEASGAVEVHSLTHTQMKDRPVGWFAPRVWAYSHPRIGELYTRLRGE